MFTPHCSAACGRVIVAGTDITTVTDVNLTIDATGAGKTIINDLVALVDGITNPTTSSYGLTFGGTNASTPDVNLYRSAADTLKTDDLVQMLIPTLLKQE